MPNQLTCPHRALPTLLGNDQPADWRFGTRSLHRRQDSARYANRHQRGRREADCRHDPLTKAMFTGEQVKMPAPLATAIRRESASRPAEICMTRTTSERIPRMQNQ